MGLKIIFLLCIVVGLFSLTATNRRSVRIVLSFLILSNVLFLISNTIWPLIGKLIFFIPLLQIMIYSFQATGILNFHRWLIFLSAFIILLKTLFMLQHWPGANLMLMLTIIQIAFYSFLVINPKKLSKHEFGFMTVITGNSVYSFIQWLSIYLLVHKGN